MLIRICHSALIIGRTCQSIVREASIESSCHYLLCKKSLFLLRTLSTMQEITMIVYKSINSSYFEVNVMLPKTLVFHN